MEPNLKDTGVSDFVEMPNLSIVMTVFNRLELTINCLERLFEQAGLDTSFQLQAVVVDDGSTDSTSEVLRSRFGSRVRVVSSSGGLFWSKGMALAQQTASSADPDFVVWLNNDVVLSPDAIVRLLATYESQQSPTIVVGAMMSPATGLTSYSGFRQVSSRPGHLRMIVPTDEPQLVDTLNGNLVLIPREIYATVGVVDDTFSHAYGDLDYGLRARRSGYSVVLAAGYFGECDRNPVDGTWEDTSLHKRARLNLLLSRKGLPIVSHVRFVKRYSPILWPAFVAVTYVKRCAKIAVGR